jgi:hypothetical protein
MAVDGSHTPKNSEKGKSKLMPAIPIPSEAQKRAPGARHKPQHGLILAAVSISSEWFPEPGDLIEPAEPPKRKPDLRDFFKLPPEPAASTPLWPSTPPPRPLPVWPTGKRIRSAKRKYDLAKRLLDSRMLLASLRWYDAHLIPREEIILKPPRREKSRKLNFYWRYYMEAARRVCGVVYRQHLLHEDQYHIRHPVWTTLQLRFGFENNPKMNFLWDPEVEAKFKQLKPDFKITAPELVKLDKGIGSLLLEKTREYLLRDIDKETREMFELEEVERKIDRRSVKKNKPSAAATQLLAPAKEPTVKEFATAVKAWLRCH